MMEYFLTSPSFFPLSELGATLFHLSSDSSFLLTRLWHKGYGKDECGFYVGEVCLDSNDLSLMLLCIKSLWKSSSGAHTQGSLYI
jgi:hypothetical protein